jgi:cobalt-zinc-cadmium efflux system protein
LTGWTLVDPIGAIGIGLWVLPCTWVLLRDTINVLLEGVPVGLRLSEIRKAVEAVPGDSGVHDLHVWSTSTDDVNCTVHVEIGDRSKAILRRSQPGWKLLVFKGGECLGA